MTNELSNLILEVELMDNVTMMDISHLWPKLKKGAEEEPEKIWELMQSYEKLIERSAPTLSLDRRWDLVLGFFARQSYIVDNKRYKEGVTNINFINMLAKQYLSNPDRYGPIAKALSNHFRCKGKALAQMMLEK